MEILEVKSDRETFGSKDIYLLPSIHPSLRATKAYWAMDMGKIDSTDVFLIDSKVNTQKVAQFADCIWFDPKYSGTPLIDTRSSSAWKDYLFGQDSSAFEMGYYRNKLGDSPEAPRPEQFKKIDFSKLNLEADYSLSPDDFLKKYNKLISSALSGLKGGPAAVAPRPQNPSPAANKPSTNNKPAPIPNSNESNPSTPGQTLEGKYNSKPDYSGTFTSNKEGSGTWTLKSYLSKGKSIPINLSGVFKTTDVTLSGENKYTYLQRHFSSDGLLIATHNGEVNLLANPSGPYSGRWEVRKSKSNTYTYTNFKDNQAISTGQFVFTKDDAYTSLIAKGSTNKVKGQVGTWRRRFDLQEAPSDLNNNLYTDTIEFNSRDVVTGAETRYFATSFDNVALFNGLDSNRWAAFGINSNEGWSQDTKLTPSQYLKTSHKTNLLEITPVLTGLYRGNTWSYLDDRITIYKDSNNNDALDPEDQLLASLDTGMDWGGFGNARMTNGTWSLNSKNVLTMLDSSGPYADPSKVPGFQLPVTPFG